LCSSHKYIGKTEVKVAKFLSISASRGKFSKGGFDEIKRRSVRNGVTARARNGSQSASNYSAITPAPKPAIPVHFVDAVTAARRTWS
jgi:hypothetical protein